MISYYCLINKKNISYGSKYLLKQCLKTLPQAYKLLNRTLYAEILEKHAKNRVDETKNPEFFT